MVDPLALSKIENGHRSVTDIEVKALAKGLKVSMGWLLKEYDGRIPIQKPLCFSFLPFSDDKKQSE